MSIPESAVFIGRYVPGTKSILLALALSPIVMTVLYVIRSPVCNLFTDERVKKVCDKTSKSKMLNFALVTIVTLFMYKQFHAMHYRMANIDYFETMKSMREYAKLFPNINIALHNHGNK